MKPLTDVEPRTAINSVNTPGDSEAVYRITQPGSYYLTGNILLQSIQQGQRWVIAVEATGVTLDLSGFEIRATANANPEWLIVGISSNRLIVRNGSLTGGSHGAISANSGSTFESLRVDSGGINATGSVGIKASGSSIIRDCTVGGYMTGILAMNGTLVESCTARVSTSTCIVLDRSTARGCTVTALYAGIAAGDGSRVLDNLVRGGDSGIVIGSSSRAEGNTVVGSTGFGIRSVHSSSIAFRNDVSQCAVGYSPGGAKWGPQVTDPSATNSPWANFSR